MTLPQWPMPNITTKSDGLPRQVGVEFEVQGIDVDMLARLTALTLRGKDEAVSEAEYLISVPEQGDYRVEVDYTLLKQVAKEQQEANDDDQTKLETLTLDALSAVSTVIVPCEVVAPPLPMERFGQPIQTLTDAIRDAGGKGTGRSLFYALGVHLNVEPPDLEAHTIVSYMKAFACLYDWIVWKGEVDWARRMTSHIMRYPEEYDLRLTDPEYWPNLETLIVDYLGSNASRDRAMDMLPLFYEISPDVVRTAIDDDRIKPRPAFHYRLANCAIDDPDWSIADPWRRWLQIEHLASDRDALNDCCEEYRSSRQRPLPLHLADDGWRESVAKWLRQW